MPFRIFIFLVFVHAVTGCASYIAEKIESPGGSRFTFSGITLIEQGIYQDQFCTDDDAACLPFIYAGAEPCSTGAEMDMYLSLEGTPTGDIYKSFHHKIIEPQYRGVVVFVHGFRSTSLSVYPMLNVFSCLGFDTFSMDLLGHGESHDKFGYGVKDAELMTQFIEQLPNNVGPIILVGHSMGALTATRTAVNSSRISGLYLLAPMDKFDDAAVGVASMFSPLLSYFIPDSQIKAGAQLALQHAGIALEETDIKPVLATLDVPTLIYGTHEDEASILARGDLILSNNLIKMIDREGENHLSVIAFDDEQLTIFLDWLQQVMPESAKKKRFESRPDYNLIGHPLVKEAVYEQ